MKHAITGKINSGKSYFARELKRRMNYQIIEVDDIRRHILWQSIKEEHILLRRNLGELFSLPVWGPHAVMNREIFTQKIFETAENLYNYSQLATPVIKKYISEIQGENSFLVWVYIIEENYDELCNGKIIEVVMPTIKHRETELIEHRSKIQDNNFFVKKKNSDVKYNQSFNIDLFIRNYL